MKHLAWKNYLHYLTFALAVLLFSACTDTGLFLPMPEEERPVEILTVADGTVLRPADTVSVEIVFEGETLDIDEMYIAVETSAGEVLFSRTLGPEEIQLLPTPVQIPDSIETGRYLLRVTLSYLGETIAERQTELYVESEPHEITGVVSHPSIFYPGGRGLVIATIDAPDMSDPYLRWRSQDEIIAEGYLSEGLDAIDASAPDREGVFSLSLELFPLVIPLDQPPAVETVSTNRFDVQFFVSNDQPPELHELLPEKHYTTLFHFRGERVDRGREADPEQVSEFGMPGLALESGSFGYLFDESAGILVERSLFPLRDSIEESIEESIDDSQQASGIDAVASPAIIPFSFTFRGLIESYGTILTIRDADDTVFAAIDLDEAGSPGITIDGIASRIESTIVPLEETVELTVSVVPEEQSIHFLWFLSGYPIGEEVVAHDGLARPDDPYTTIGGESGISMIVDELGVFSAGSEEVDSSVFSRAMKLAYGSDLVFAEGFDGLVFPEQTAILDADDEARVESGAGIIPAGARIELPSIPIDFASLRLEIVPASGVVEIEAFVDIKSSPSLDRVVRFESGIGYLSPDDQLLAAPFGSGTIAIDLEIENQRTRLVTPERAIELGSIPYADASLIVTIGASDAGDVAIDSILATKNRIDRPSASDE